MSNLMAEVRHYLGGELPPAAAKAVEITYDRLRKGAAHRIRKSLLQAMPDSSKYSWHYNPHFEAAVSHLSELAAAAVFGDIPLTQQQKEDNQKVIQHLMDPALFYQAAQQLDQWPGGQYEGTSMLESAKKSKPVTMADLHDAAEKLKAGNSGLPGAGKVKTYAPVKMGKGKGKTVKGPDPDEALAKLQAIVEKKSDELLGIKQDAKKKELMGLDPEEI